MGSGKATGLYERLRPLLNRIPSLRIPEVGMATIFRSPSTFTELLKHLSDGFLNDRRNQVAPIAVRKVEIELRLPLIRWDHHLLVQNALVMAEEVHLLVEKARKSNLDKVYTA